MCQLNDLTECKKLYFDIDEGNEKKKLITVASESAFALEICRLSLSYKFWCVDNKFQI